MRDSPRRRRSSPQSGAVREAGGCAAGVCPERGDRDAGVASRPAVPSLGDASPGSLLSVRVPKREPDSRDVTSGRSDVSRLPARPAEGCAADTEGTRRSVNDGAGRATLGVLLSSVDLGATRETGGGAVGSPGDGGVRAASGFLGRANRIDGDRSTAPVPE